MTDPEGDLSRRLRANRGRQHRHEFTARVERALGTRITAGDVLDLATTDRLAEAVATRLRADPPTLTWAEARRAEVIGHVNAISKNLKENHVSYMIYFRGWEELGALRVRSAGACAHVAGLWDERAEAFCLVTEDVSDGLYLDYTDPDQLNGDDEYELWAWGAFLRLK